MRLNSRTWMVISLLLFAGAAYFWYLGEKRSGARRGDAKPAAVTNTTSPIRTSQAPGQVPVPPVLTNTNAAAAKTNLLQNRLTNTSKTLRQLQQSDTAILLRNALIDTAEPLNLNIPEHLKSKGDPGSWIVQSRKALDEAFYTTLRRAGAQFVSYIPNNAALVTATPERAKALARYAQIKSVLPYEPYYKLDLRLLSMAIHKQSLGTNNLLSVTAHNREAGLQMAKAMGAEILGEEQTPFGTGLVVSAPADQWIELAQSPAVLELEPFNRRSFLNDLTRVTTTVAANTIVDTNWLNLTGTNIVVGVNDSGVDATHPDLTGRILGLDEDWDGHGTHVAGIIAGDGSQSATVTNASGSVPGANFRGKAPGAKLFVQPVDLITGPYISDTYLQTNAAAQTNLLICNNSWGYRGRYDYTMSSASYDAATRDAVPGMTNAQPLLFVFAAGNDGEGSQGGGGGVGDTILSPGNAKNVITVGALESRRRINDLTIVDGVTNARWKGWTDTATEVAFYSSRGNTGIGIEGDYGRIKPDVVAPGTFVVSTRMTNYIDPIGYYDLRVYSFPDQKVFPGQTNINEIDVPWGAMLMNILITPNAASPIPFPTNWPVYADPFTPPTTLRGTTNSPIFPVDSQLWYVGVENTTNQPISFDLTAYVLITNIWTNYFEVLSNVNARLGPYYRYETGTSMAAPAVSGMLALMQEYLEGTLGIQPSPALLKAMLINGADTTESRYDYTVNRDGPNCEGWGLANISNSLPSITSPTNGTLQFFDQSPGAALATGQSVTREITLAPDAQGMPLRITLVWTDPPGNPAAGIKLVNDLDLIVTNLDTTNIYVGNNFAADSTYTDYGPNPASTDIINNVENVYIAGDEATNNRYSVTIRAKRVNVNALPQHPDGIVQDFALVISSAARSTNALFSVSDPVLDFNPAPSVQTLSNGIPILYQRLGANSPLLGDTNGTLKQWRFYVFNNAATNSANFTNVAIVTFMPPELSIPRETEADIDLYVSKDPRLLLLDPAVIATASKSTNRGGSEMIIYTDSVPGDIYYVGVKSEDHQGAEFGIAGVATDKPFGQKDENGNIYADLITPLPFLNVPDGLPVAAKGTLIVANVVNFDDPTFRVRKASVIETNLHEHLGDTTHSIQHNGKWTVLDTHASHESTDLTYTVTYDDTIENDPQGAIRTIGPGSLTDYRDRPGQGPWLLYVSENSMVHTGSVQGLTIRVDPKQETNVITRTLGAYSWYIDYLELPSDVLGLKIKISYVSGDAPLGSYLRKYSMPDATHYDKSQPISPPGNILSLSTNDVPPVSEGLWFYGINNDTDQTVTIRIEIEIERSNKPDLVLTLPSSGDPVTVLDDATVESKILVDQSAPVLAVQTGVRINHPRVSDLVLRLISPQGTKVMLFEDRGWNWNTATNLGLGDGTNDGFVYTVFTEDTNYASQFIKFANPPYAQFQGTTGATVLFTEGFEAIAATNYTAPQALGPNWLLVSNQVTIANDGRAFAGSNYLALADGRITRVLPTRKGYNYMLRHMYRYPGITDWWPGDGKANDLINTNHGTVSTNGMFSMGVVARAFNFHGNAAESVTFNTNVGNFGTNDFTVDFWIRTSSSNDVPEAVMDKRPRCGPCSFWSIRKNDLFDEARIGLIGFEICENNAAANYAGVTSTTHINDGLFHHYAATRQGRNLSLYIDGVLETNLVTAGIANLANNKAFQLGLSPCISGPGLPDNTDPMLGHIDELDFFNRAITPAEVGAIFRAGTAGKYNNGSALPNTLILIGNSTNQLISTDTLWQTNSIGFVAEEDNTVLQLVGGPLSVLFDNFELIELPSTNYANYYLPEESLSVFKGENPQGYWTLQVTDTRAGAGITNLLLSWNLQLTLSSANIPMTVLTNGIPCTNTVPSNSISYFAVDVPNRATVATNILFSLTPGDPLDLLFNQTALPTGDLPGDVTMLYQVGTGGAAYELRKNGTPPFLRPGERYFLGVSNPNPTPQTFSLTVQFDVRTNYTITRLDTGISIATNIADNAGMQYYYYDVTTNAMATAFEVLNPNGDVDLLACRDFPPPDPLRFDYISSNQGTNNESIVILPDSSPVPLAPGRWYLGVYNYTNIPVDYTIQATETVPQIIDLTDGAFWLDTIPAGPPYATFYALTLTNSTAAAVEFLVTNMNGDVDLLARRNAFPTMSRADRGSFNFGVTAERIVFATNAALPTLDGTWYLAVPNNTATPARCRIRATTSNTGTNFPAAPFQFTALGVSTSGVTFQWNSDIRQEYAVDVSSDLQTWQNLTNIVSTTANTTFTDNTTATTNSTRFYRLRQLPWP